MTTTEFTHDPASGRLCLGCATERQIDAAGDATMFGLCARHLRTAEEQFATTTEEGTTA